MARNLRGFIVFAIMVTVVLGALRLLSWIPEAVQGGTLRRFESIEEAKGHLKLSLYLPAFYPDSIRWPPLLISGQTIPYPAVLTEFSAKDRDGVLLVITQTAKQHQPLRERIRLASLREQVRYPFKGRTALLEVGACEDGKPCSRFSWEEGPFAISLTTKSAPMELVKMAESIIPRDGQTGESADKDAISLPGGQTRKIYRGK